MSTPAARSDPIIISNPTVAKAQAAAAQFKLPEFSGDAMDVINHPDVEAVWICSPCATRHAPARARSPAAAPTEHSRQHGAPRRCRSQFHAEQIKACAAVGKHVFCEKPIAVSLSETFEAVNLCREKVRRGALTFR